jgi:DNA-3-methyladenine glycosylase
VPPWVAAKQAGTAYVYMNYGMYWLLNVLVKGGREDGFVLIRALEPVDGIEQMRKRRKKEKAVDLCSGPGKLSQAFGITGGDHGRDLCGGDVGFGPRRKPVEVVTDVRVGISRSAHLQWRFLLAGSPYVSVKHGKVPAPKILR